MAESVTSTPVDQQDNAVSQWQVYMLRCGDDSLYTGMTNKLDIRIEQHQSGQGARYTRSRLPVQLVYQEELTSRSEALKREYAIKQLSRISKLKLIESRS